MTTIIPPLYDKKLNCLLCNEPFFSKRLRSRYIRIDKVHSDFYQEYKDPELNPYYYEVDVCPTCGFASSENFSPMFPPNSKDEITRTLSGWTSQNFGMERDVDDAIRTMKLGLLSASLKQEKHIVIAGLCLRLSWMYRIKDNSNQEQRFLQEAITHYKLSYELVDFLSTKMTEIRLLYMIGELSRRAGNDKDAMRNFSRVIEHKNKEFDKRTVEMAREQWYLMRHEKENAVSI